MKKKFLSLILVMGLLLAFMPLGASALTVEGVELPDDGVNIAIVHTNDTHGRLLAADGIIGFAKIAQKIEDLRAISGLNVMAMDAGDTTHGLPIASISKGEAVINVLNEIGYDAMTYGNHDFNYGSSRAKELATKFNGKALVANVTEDASGAPYFDQYFVKDVSGKKIGVFGMTTPETKYKSHPKNTEGLTIEDPVATAKKMVEALKAEGADYIIALTHLGYQEGDDTSDNLAKNVEGIDLIIDGHSHTVLPNGQKVNNTYIAQTGEYDKNLGIVYINIKDDGTKTTTPTLLSAEDMANVDENPEVKALLDTIATDNEALLAEEVGKTDVDLDGEREHVRTGETNLGNLIAESMLDGAEGAEIAFTNGGGIRASIPAGTITKKNVLEVLPFGNQLVSIKVSGENIVKALEFGVRLYPEANGGFPHIAGMTFKFDPNQPEGSRVYDVMVGGKPIDLKKIYTVATNDFLAAGGDGYEMLTDTDPVEYKSLDEVLADYIKANGVEEAVTDGRVTVAAKPAVEEPKPEEPKPEKPEEVKPEVIVANTGDNTSTEIFAFFMIASALTGAGVYVVKRKEDRAA